jgi:Fe2+ or Zn2+ uptake regulation protein
MSSQTVWLPTALYTALIRLQMDDFTTTECLNAVFGDSEYNQAHKRRYGLVYRNLMKLVNTGFLERRNVDDVRLYPSFVKTPLFHDVIFQEELSDPATQGEQEVQEVQEVQEQEYKEESNNALLDELNEKASLYRIEIQECQAAIAEYNMLQTNFPALEITIDNALHNTSQKYRDLRGRLAAVEKVMRALGGSDLTC